MNTQYICLFACIAIVICWLGLTLALGHNAREGQSSTAMPTETDSADALFRTNVCVFPFCLSVCGELTDRSLYPLTRDARWNDRSLLVYPLFMCAVADAHLQWSTRGGPEATPSVVGSTNSTLTVEDRIKVEIKGGNQ